MEAATRRAFLAAGAAGAAAAVPLKPKTASARSSIPIERQGLLEGKVAVIYGAAGAIGSAVSRAFAREGAHVELAGRTLEKVQALAAEISAAGGSTGFAKVDALVKESIEKHLEAVVAARGRLDISFNLISVPGAQGESLATMAPETFAEPVGFGVRTHFLTATAAARHMASRKTGVILALTAQVARKPYAGSGGFGVACAAIEDCAVSWPSISAGDGIRAGHVASSGSPDTPGVSAAVAEHARLAGVSREVFEACIAEKTMLQAHAAHGGDRQCRGAHGLGSRQRHHRRGHQATCGEIAD